MHDKFITHVPVYSLHVWPPKPHVQIPVAGSRMPATVTVKTGLWSTRNHTRDPHKLPSPPFLTAASQHNQFHFCTWRTSGHSHPVLRQHAAAYTHPLGLRRHGAAHCTRTLTLGPAPRPQWPQSLTTLPLPLEMKSVEELPVVAAFLLLVQEVILSPTTPHSLFMLYHTDITHT